VSILSRTISLFVYCDDVAKLTIGPTEPCITHIEQLLIQIRSHCDIEDRRAQFVWTDSTRFKRHLTNFRRQISVAEWSPSALTDQWEERHMSWILRRNRMTSNIKKRRYKSAEKGELITEYQSRTATAQRFQCDRRGIIWNYQAPYPRRCSWLLPNRNFGFRVSLEANPLYFSNGDSTLWTCQSGQPR
jgi:hypothetical protein